ncbi:hypothetical protein ACFSM5_07815 [Lacibacterium aquatile]|uniref:Tyr recombinase domain-containing protein n=1 Tax=Lacibacterium aquatile TaxID=1168082 RepID=A0ABW5DTC1_9PROT
MYLPRNVFRDQDGQLVVYDANNLENSVFGTLALSTYTLGKSLNTQIGYARVLVRFLDHVANTSGRPPEDLRQSDFDSFFDMTRNSFAARVLKGQIASNDDQLPQRAKTTNVGEQSKLWHLFNALEMRGLAKNPMFVPAWTEHNGRKTPVFNDEGRDPKEIRIPDEQELELLLEAMPRAWRPLCIFLLETGARFSEAVGVFTKGWWQNRQEFRDGRFKRAALVPIIGKGYRKQSLRVPEAGLEAAQAIVKSDFCVDGKLITYAAFRYRLGKASRVAELAEPYHAHPHIFRHCFASRLWLEETNEDLPNKLIRISKALRHKDSITTLNYLHRMGTRPPEMPPVKLEDLFKELRDED